MPVDTSYVNDIIKAFQAGSEIKRTKEAAATQKVQHDEQLKLEQDKLKQQQEIETKRLALEQSVRDVQNLMASQTIANKFSEGEAIPGAKIRKPEEVPGVSGDPNKGFETTSISKDPDIPGGSVEINHPILGKIIAQTPETKDRADAKRLATLQEPALAKLRETEKLKLQSDLALEKVKADAEAKLKSQAQAFESEKQEKDLLNKIEVENIRGGYRLKATAMTADKVTPAQKDKFADFKDLRNSVQEIKDIFEATPGGYEAYYQGGGPIGGVKELMTNVVAGTTKFGAEGEYTQEDLRQKLAAVELKAKNLIGKLGGALTPNEQKMLEQLAPSPGVNFTSDRGRSRVNGFLQGIDNSLATMGAGTQSSSGNSGPKVIKHSKDGKVIPE